MTSLQRDDFSKFDAIMTDLTRTTPYVNTTGVAESTTSTRIESKQRTVVKALRYYGNMALRRIAHLTKLPLSTVGLICNEPVTPSREPERPSVITTPITCRILDYVTSSAEHRQLAYREISEHLNLNLSVTTIRKILNDNGYHRRVAVAKPFLTDNAMAKRLAFAQKYSHWNKSDWSRVIFTDEAAIQNGGSNRCWITRKPDEAYTRDCIRPKFRRISYCMC